jgi:hypothetical protein
MPNWKKVITSGSDAQLKSLQISGDLSVTGSLNITTPSTPSTQELLATFKVDDSLQNLRFINGASTNNILVPVIVGENTTTNNTNLIIRGETDSINDNGTNPLVLFDGRLTGGTVTTRPLFQWRSFSTNYMTMLANGSLGLNTTAPTERFDVNGNARVRGDLQFADTGKTINGGVGAVMNINSGVNSMVFRQTSNAFMRGNTSGVGIEIAATPSLFNSAILALTSTTQGFLPSRMTTVQRDAIVGPSTGLLIFNTTTSKHEGYNGSTWVSLGTNSNQIVFVSSKLDLPTPVAGVITLLANITYFFTTTVDLTGDRLVCGQNTTILGGSSENCRIKSTGLVGTALITSNFSLPIRGITIEANLALNLDGDGTTTAIDWFGVNFTDCATIGTIKDYSNIILTDCAFLNSGNLTLDGTIGTFGAGTCLFDCNSGSTVFILPSTLTISRRFRIIYSSFVVLSGETGININASASIPTESYILDTVNFAGGGTYLSGIDHTSNDSLFINCVGIINTAVNGQLYMQNNATATVVSATNTFYKVLGTTSASTDNSKFTHSNNRLTCDAIISRKYLIQANLSFTAGNGNVCEFGFFDSQLVGIRTPSRTKGTANSAGRAENISFFCVLTMKQGDYLEVHTSNTSSITNITVDQMNFIITEIK